MFQTNSTIAYPGTAPRTAEHSDARMGIQRREDEPQRRQGGKKRRDEGTLTNDEASVSVAALQMFLTNLLQANETRQEIDIAMEANAASMTQDTTIRTSAAPANFASPSARAARAYASASRTARRTPAMESALITQENPLAASARPRLSALEREQIAVLQENLAALTTLGVHDLTIQRSDTFLGSLAGSAQAALDEARGL